MNLQIIPSSQIDKAKWDACVSASSNGLIYAESKYLNTMADNWDGLVVDAYKAVMPLPWRRKWGVKYLYTPPFVQQLGLIGEVEIDLAYLEKYLLAFVKYGDYLFNESNTAFAKTFDSMICNNFLVDLSIGYQKIRSGYKKSFLKNVVRANKQTMVYSESNSIEEVTELFYNYNKSKITHVSQNSFIKFNQLCKQFQLSGKVIIRKVTDSRNELLSCVLLLKDNKRYYNLINYTSKHGRQCEANYFLYDNILAELADEKMLFDFEGSDLAGVKSFYESMGAINQPYLHWHFNYLPWWLRLIKK